MSMSVESEQQADIEKGEVAPIADPLSQRRQRSVKRQDYVLSVLVPVYNEHATLLELLARVREVEINKEIILVDDGSNDGTRDLMRNEIEGKFPDVKVFYHPQNRGNGGADRRALEIGRAHV